MSHIIGSYKSDKQNQHHQQNYIENQQILHNEQVEAIYTNTNTIQEENEINSAKYSKMHLENSTQNVTPINDEDDDNQHNTNKIQDMSMLQSCTTSQEEIMSLIPV